ncbi:hypothetical protein [Gordonia effusa]|nr:hypothetical protein [Gordonia effusa]
MRWDRQSAQVVAMMLDDRSPVDGVTTMFRVGTDRVSRRSVTGLNVA